jgi:hypothetical protein
LTDLKTAPQEHSALRERYYRAGVVMAGILFAFIKELLPQINHR